MERKNEEKEDIDDEKEKKDFMYFLEIKSSFSNLFSKKWNCVCVCVRVYYFLEVFLGGGDDFEINKIIIRRK